jgi:hypothetical protein
MSKLKFAVATLAAASLAALAAPPALADTGP